LRVKLTEEARSAFRRVCVEAKEEPLANLVDRAAGRLGAGPHLDYNHFLAELETLADEAGVKLSGKRLKLLQSALAARDGGAAPLIRKTHKPGKAAPDPIRGRYEGAARGRPFVVEYEPDPELRDTEQVPLLESGGIEGFIRREVLPHVADAWFDEGSVRVGYEISFTRYFYKSEPLRTLEEIRGDILAVERETEGLLAEILSMTEPAP
jgi:type I restriction enzyme M protein